MKTFDNHIQNLFTSTGYFSEDYYILLDSLNITDQPIFITELYRRMTSGQFSRDMAKFEFGFGNIGDKIIYRFSEDDYKQAINSQPLTTERILRFEDVPDHEILKYRATAIFQERKREEIKSFIPFVEDDYMSISKRKTIFSKPEDFLDTQSIYSDLTFRFLKFPRIFEKAHINKLLKDSGFSECFYENEHFTVFKENTFSLFAKRNKPLLLKIPTTCDRKTIGNKMFHLYSEFKKNKSDYNKKEIDLRQKAFAETMFYNFQNCREMKTNNPSYENRIESLIKTIRK